MRMATHSEIIANSPCALIVSLRSVECHFRGLEHRRFRELRRLWQALGVLASARRLGVDNPSMFKRGMLYVGGLVASVVVPYLIFGDGSLWKNPSAWTAWLSSNSTSGTNQLSEFGAGGIDNSFAAGRRGGGLGGPK